MNSRTGFVILVLCLMIGTLCVESITISLKARLTRRRRRTAAPTRRPTTAPTVPNAITAMLRNSVKPALKHVDDLMDIMTGT